jgi:hypothetical protein
MDHSGNINSIRDYGINQKRLQKIQKNIENLGIFLASFHNSIIH